MTLRSRLTALARKAGLIGPCPLCDGRGSIEQYVLEIGETAPEPRGCPGCGRINGAKYVFGDGTREEDFGFLDGTQEDDYE